MTFRISAKNACGAIVAAIALLGSGEAKATDFCAVLYEAAVVNVRACSGNWRICLGDPNCCLPAPVCLADPICVVLAVTNVPDGGTVCNLSLDDFMNQWTANNIMNLADTLAVLPFSSAQMAAALDSHFEAMALRGRSIPDNVSNILVQLVERYPGTFNGFDSAEVFEARIISNSDTEAGVFLPSDKTAITLGAPIVLGKLTDGTDVFQSLTSTEVANISLEDIQWGRAPLSFILSLEVLAHELVHFRQARNVGLEKWWSTYLAAALLVGGAYQDIDYEKSAYLQSALLSKENGGFYCEITKPFHLSNIDAFSLEEDIVYGTCPVYGPFAAFLSLLGKY